MLNRQVARQESPERIHKSQCCDSERLMMTGLGGVDTVKQSCPGRISLSKYRGRGLVTSEYEIW
jgi:hypothetical protein